MEKACIFSNVNKESKLNSNNGIKSVFDFIKFCKELDNIVFRTNSYEDLSELELINDFIDIKNMRYNVEYIIGYMNCREHLGAYAIKGKNNIYFYEKYKDRTVKVRYEYNLNSNLFSPSSRLNKSYLIEFRATIQLALLCNPINVMTDSYTQSKLTNCIEMDKKELTDLYNTLNKVLKGLSVYPEYYNKPVDYIPMHDINKDIYLKVYFNEANSSKFRNTYSDYYSDMMLLFNYLLDIVF